MADYGMGWAQGQHDRSEGPCPFVDEAIQWDEEPEIDMSDLFEE